MILFYDNSYTSNIFYYQLITMQACTNFLAGHMLRSKSRYSALDETAIMGAACRHECPTPCFFSLKHGERSVLCCMCVYG